MGLRKQLQCAPGRLPNERKKFQEIMKKREREMRSYWNAL